VDRAHRREALDGRDDWYAARERGSVTAEFAAVVPAVVVVLAVSLGGLQLATQQLRLQDAAALVARDAARGADTAGLADSLVPGSKARLERRGDLVCAHVTGRGTRVSALLGAATITATSCALAGGR
jgi:hypothetical protein